MHCQLVIKNCHQFPSPQISRLWPDNLPPFPVHLWWETVLCISPPPVLLFVSLTASALLKLPGGVWGVISVISFSGDRKACIARPPFRLHTAGVRHCLFWLIGWIKRVEKLEEKPHLSSEAQAICLICLSSLSSSVNKSIHWYLCVFQQAAQLGPSRGP